MQTREKLSSESLLGEGDVQSARGRRALRKKCSRNREQGGRVALEKDQGENQGSELEKLLALQLRQLRPQGPRLIHGHTGGTSQAPASFTLGKPGVLLKDVVLGAGVAA